jgi:DNA-binding Lrp family transcriptional regulator
MRETGFISFRWGIPELDHGNVIIPEPLYRFHGQLGVTGNLFVLIVQLAAFKYESPGSIACPSFQTLADRMALSRRRVIELVDELERAGWLLVTRRGPYRNEYDMRPFAQACWDLYKAATSAESRTSIGGAASAENVTSTSAESRTPLVRNPAPEEQEDKNKKSKNTNPLSAHADPPAKPTIFCEGSNYSEAFERLWVNWLVLNRGIDKRGAARQWNATLRSRMNGTKPEDAAERIVVAAGKFAEAMRLDGRTPDLVMHAARFLGRDQCWTDYENWRPATVTARASERTPEDRGAGGHDPAIYQKKVKGPKEESGVTAPGGGA